MSIDVVWHVALFVYAVWIGTRIGKTNARINADLQPANRSKWPIRRPEGVRIIHRDGTETLCEPVYQGVDSDGDHIWEIATPFNPMAGDDLRVDVLPGHTGLTFPTNDFRATAHPQEDQR